MLYQPIYGQTENDTKVRGLRFYKKESGVRSQESGEKPGTPSSGAFCDMWGLPGGIGLKKRSQKSGEKPVVTSSKPVFRS